MSGTDIVKHPIHPGRGAIAVVEPLFTGNMEWYQGYTGRHADCSLHHFRLGHATPLPLRPTG